ncbi:hypothetical protein BaRGS_00000991 [Batillaria attramentaria]|uniref:Uncharacterized protein n=1 Tax=Batillaria attramentaria TaxID=370345 RepID=A0ABD0M9G0_9CAEN
MAHTSDLASGSRCTYTYIIVFATDTLDYSGSGSGSGDQEMDDDVTSYTSLSAMMTGPTTVNTTGLQHGEGDASIAEYISDRLFVFLGVILTLVALAVAVCLLIRHCYGKRGTRVIRRVRSSFQRQQKQREKEHTDT